MGKTKIEWCGYTVNPVKGKCPMACPYCYARRMYDRFKWNPEARYDHDWWQSLRRIKAGNKIFVGSTFELFHDSISDWLHPIFKWVRTFNDLTFIFLTKCPQNLIKFSPFPENCWVGVTATTARGFGNALQYMPDVKSEVKFVSFEPLLERIRVTERLDDFQWLIIGQQTPVSKKTEPKIEWVREIVEAADKAGVKVFLKNNLKPLLTSQGSQDNRFWRDMTDSRGFEPLHTELRQEMPDTAQKGYIEK